MPALNLIEGGVDTLEAILRDVSLVVRELLCAAHSRYIKVYQLLQ
jgi:hypothetical protein